ncbi:MAG: FAD-binding oxidoreductase [Roseiflexaceae bacterium]
MSISGKTSIDWKAFQAALGDIPTIDRPALVKQRSRDFFWYSPLLDRQLNGCYGDLVAQPRNQAELIQCMQLAYQWEVPVVLRGGGTGNYGQAVPLDGGLILETLGLDQILEIGPGFVRVEAGCKIGKLNEALKATGQELPIFPSTQDMATIGGFVAGGSGGIGSLKHGMLRDPGNIIEIVALSMEAEPQRHVFTGETINLIHHAWGINGVMVELTLRVVPARTWINCIASFGSYREAYTAGIALGSQADLGCKLVTTLDGRIVRYFHRLRDRIGSDRALMVSLIDQQDLAIFDQIVHNNGGRVELQLDDQQRQEAELPHVFEFSYNHTTLQVLKTDKNCTYLQVTYPAPLDPAKIDQLQPLLGDDVLMHHEFSRLNDQLVSFDIPIVRYSSDQRLAEIMAIYEAHGCPVSNPHTCIIEDGGMKKANYRHLALKKQLDPKGLLNSNKSREWRHVKDRTPAEILELLNEA